MTVVLVGFVLLLLQSSTVQAQWSTSGSNTTTTNNVGIGTTSPSGTKLHVVYNTGNDATILAEAGSGMSPALEFKDAAATPNRWRVGSGLNSTTDGMFFIYDKRQSATRMIIDTSGNVGIGTTNPAYGKLQVNKMIRIDDDSGSANGSDTVAASPSLYLGTSGGGGLFQFNGGGGIDLWQYNNAAFGRTVTFAKTGNVGIGTAYPIEKLEVNGTVKSSGLTVTGAPAEPAYLNGLFLGMSGNTATIDAVDQMVDFRDLVISNKTFQVKSWNGGGLVTGLFQNNSGNVGVGTTTPTAKLHIISVDDTVAPALSIRQDSNPAYGFDFTLDTNVNGNLSVNRINNGTSANLLTFDRAGGNVGLGTTSPTSTLHVVGTGRFTGNLTVDGNIAAKYQDVAEWVQSSQTLPVGTVVVLDQTKSNQVIASSQAYDTRVAGVISLQPGIALGESGAGKVLVATTGRVRIKVDASRGAIQIGDLLVTSDVPGVAMKSQPIDVGGAQIHRPGTLIGKALEPLAKGTSEILVLLSLQ